MKTLPELLREADPLGFEPSRTPQDRRRIRQQVLDLPRAVDNPPRRRLVLASMVAVTLVGIAAGSLRWPGWAVAVAAVRFEARLAEENPARGLRETVIAFTGRKIYLHQEVVVTNSDIAEAHVVQGETAAKFSVSVTFSAEGAAKMLRATRGHLGKPLALLLDGQVVLAPVVRAAIGPSAIISGDYTRAEAERIVGGIVGR